MHDENQTHVPDSFVLLYKDAAGRLTASRDDIASRSEMCEDMANLLSEHARSVHFRDGISEDEVLRRSYHGLLTTPGSFNPMEAEWVVRRTAELLQWPWDGMEELRRP